MNKLMLAAVSAALITGACASDTAKLSVGQCVEVDSSFTFGGNVDTVSCSEVGLLNSIYRVQAVGSESEVDVQCPIFGLIIVDGDDAACLVK